MKMINHIQNTVHQILKTANAITQVGKVMKAAISDFETLFEDSYDGLDLWYVHCTSCKIF